MPRRRRIIRPDVGIAPAGIGHNSQVKVETDQYIPLAYWPLLQPKRYKIFFGGRGAAKTMSIASAIVTLMIQIQPRFGQPFRVLCSREYQTSIRDSVHFELVAAINRMGLSPFFKVTDKSIVCRTTGAHVLFRGLHHNVQQIKSLGGIDLCWCEEAHSLTKDSLIYLDPTIRRDAPFGPLGQGSEIWLSLNQHEDTDPVWEYFKLGLALENFIEMSDGKTTVRHRGYSDDRKIIVPVTYEDNPYFPDVLEKQRQEMEKDDDRGLYEWIWGTSCRRMGSSVIFKGKYIVEEFDTPDGPETPQFFFGADWGFAVDPVVLIRAWHRDEHLYVDYESYGDGVEMDETPALFCGDDVNNSPPRWPNPHGWRGVPGAATWPIKGDNSRPETISYLRRRGLNISAAEKWPGSVEDGIAHLKAFKMIHIHPRCKRFAQEARMYSYKVDPKTQEVLPVVLGKHDHGWDALRYAHDGYIQRRGGLANWMKLASMYS